MSWINRSGTWVSKKPVLPGVWQVKTGGFLIRARIKNLLGKKVEIKKVIMCSNKHEAYQILNQESQRIRKISEVKNSVEVNFTEFAQNLLAQRINSGELRSPSTINRWRVMLRTQLLPAFGKYRMDQLRRSDIIKYRDAIAALCVSGKYSPRTAQGWLKTLKVILREYVVRFDRDHDPSLGIKGIDQSIRRIYTREQPNALLPAEYEIFIETLYRLYPQHYAMAMLGFATGLRGCSLRALHKCDINFNTKMLLNRRSNSFGKGVIQQRTKTGIDQDIPLPAEMLDLLKAHLASLPDGPMAASPLLFPAPDGSTWNPHTLQEAFARTGKAAGITKRFTPHGMRRTNKDLFRLTGASQVVSMAVSGHLTEEMHHHYSTASDDELRTSIAKVAGLAPIRPLKSGKVSGKDGRYLRHVTKHLRRESTTRSPRPADSSGVAGEQDEEGFRRE